MAGIEPCGKIPKSKNHFPQVAEKYHKNFLKLLVHNMTKNVGKSDDYRQVLKTGIQCEFSFLIENIFMNGSGRNKNIES